MKIFSTILVILFMVPNLYSQSTIDSTWNTTIDYDSILESEIVFDTIWNSKEENLNQPEFSIYLQVAFEFNNFDAFEPVLGKYNTDFMNSSRAVLSYGVGGTFKKWYMGISLGFYDIYDDKNDSLDSKFSTTQWGLDVGYNLINTRRIILAPKAFFHWNRYRLINSMKDDASLSTYMSERDLDLRFNQLTGFIGLNFAYKFCYNSAVLGTNYCTTGLYGGYLFKFNSKPWIYSAGKRLTNDSKIDLTHYTFGIYFSFNFI